MHSKGLATSAVFRSSVFQIYFLGLSKLVAVKSPAPECGRWMQKNKGEHHGYSDTHNVLHVMHNHKWRHLYSVDSVYHVRPGFGVSYAEQMVSHSPGKLQRGHLLVPRVV
jgi:hypothetical protein